MKLVNWTIRNSKKILPHKIKKSQKSDYGRSLIWAGSPTYMGAAVLTSMACARAGSGYTYLATSKKFFNHFNNPDLIVIDQKELNQLNLDSYTAVALGPGLGSKHSLKTVQFLNRLKKFKQKSVVIDADALNALSTSKNWRNLNSWILTPHAKEMSRLINRSVDFVLKNPKEALVIAHKKYQGIFLLKGSSTYVFDGSNLCVLKEGHPALAKSGTGDVLTGLITGLLAQGVPSFEAACLAVFIHGRASQYWIKNNNDELSLLASDLINLLPVIIKQIRVS